MKRAFVRLLCSLLLGSLSCIGWRKIRYNQVNERGVATSIRTRDTGEPSGAEESKGGDSEGATTSRRAARPLFLRRTSAFDMVSQVMLLLCKMSTSGSSFVFLGVWHSTS